MNQVVDSTKEKILTPFNLLLLVAFCYDTIFNYVTVIAKRLPVIGAIGEYIMPAIVILLVLANVFMYKSLRAHTYDLLLLTLIIVLLCFDYLFFPNNQEFYNKHNMDLVFLKAIPFLFIGSNFVANKASFKLLIYASYFAIAINLAYIFYFMTTRDATDYNMHYAYLMLPHVMFATHGLFNKELSIPFVLKILFFVTGALFIISMGTRGPILIMMVYLIVVSWRRVSSLSIAKATIAIFIMIATMFLLLNTYTILAEALQKFIQSIGLSTRALDMLLEGEYISATSGRDLIYAELWGRILEAPLGYCLFGEWQFIDYSAHNIYIQVCMYWGLFLGTIVVAALLLLITKGYTSTENEWGKDIIILYLVFTLVRNFFGGEFFSEYVFFLIGFSFQCLSKAKTIT